MRNPLIFQRLEGLAIFIAATSIYFYANLSLIYYLAFLFAFDVFMIGYTINPRIGALIYNIGHSFIGPSLIAILCVAYENNVLLGFSCLWFAHIGIDRTLGYGLKLASGFQHTHLGNIGKK